MQSLTANVESLSSEKEILQERQNDTEFMSNGAKARRASLDAQKSQLTQ